MMQPLVDSHLYNYNAGDCVFRLLSRCHTVRTHVDCFPTGTTQFPFTKIPHISLKRTYP